MPPELPLTIAVAGALVTVSVTFYKFLIDRLKRSEEREDRRDALYDRLADLIEAALGVKAPRD